MEWYLVLLLACQVLTSVGIFLIFKLIDVKKVNQYQPLIINYLVAVITSLASIDYGIGFHLDGERSIIEMWPAILIGFLFLFNFLLMLSSTKSVGVGLTSAFSKMSVLIPVFVGILFLKQTNNLTYKIIGVILTLVSFYFILYKKEKKESKKLSAWGVILPLSVFFFSGITDEVQELSRKYLIYTTNDSKIFIFFVFSAALFFTIVLYLIDIKKNGFRFSWLSLLFGLLLGLFNYFTARLLLINVNIFGGSIVFPIVNSATVLVTTFMGMLFFKEKLSSRQWIGVGIAVLAVAFIALAI